MKQTTFILLLIFLLLTTTATAEIITAQEGSTNNNLQITLIDVYTGSSKQESGCIFNVNGETAVVDYLDKKTVNGVTIFVQDVYAVNTKAKDKDNCAFLYSLVGQQEERGDLEIDESMDLDKETVGGEEVEFLLTTRDEYEDLFQDEGEYIEVKEEIPEETAVKISGIDVTNTVVYDDTTEDDETETIEETVTEETREVTETEDIGFFAKLWQFIFG
jgi:hypothetical protein